MVKAGLIYFSESKSREDVYQQRKGMQDREIQRFIDTMADTPLRFIIPDNPEIRAKGDIPKALRQIYAEGAGAIIMQLPIFVSPALVLHAVRQSPLPCIIMGNNTLGTFSQLSQLAAGGATDQAGVPAKRLSGDISDPGLRKELLRYIKAVTATRSLLGLTYGYFGGRSIGISTGTADAAQWQNIFGIDTEHIDQYEIVLRAERIPEETVTKHKDWIKENYGNVCFKEGRFEESHLNKMVRCYLAVKELINDFELDFVGIKCQPEMSNGYILPCLAVQLLNDPYDADGAKATVPCACEADCDGALTMQILKLLSGGEPTALQDLFYVSDDRMVLANCGSSPSYYACSACSGKAHTGGDGCFAPEASGSMEGAFAGDKDPVSSLNSHNMKENLKEVYLQPHGFGKAGGAATQFVFSEGPYTYARLFRVDGEYRMGIFTGVAEKLDRSELEKYSWYRPTTFLNVSIDSKRFMREFGSNHVHCLKGDYVEDLIAFCEYNSIEYDLY